MVEHHSDVEGPRQEQSEEDLPQQEQTHLPPELWGKHVVVVVDQLQAHCRREGMLVGDDGLEGSEEVGVVEGGGDLSLSL